MVGGGNFDQNNYKSEQNKGGQAAASFQKLSYPQQPKVKRIGIKLVLLVTILILAGIIGSYYAYDYQYGKGRYRRIMNTINSVAKNIDSFEQNYSFLPGDHPEAFEIWGINCGSLLRDSCNGNGNFKVVLLDREDSPSLENLEANLESTLNFQSEITEYINESISEEESNKEDTKNISEAVLLWMHLHLAGLLPKELSISGHFPQILNPNTRLIVQVESGKEKIFYLTGLQWDLNSDSPIFIPTISAKDAKNFDQLFDDGVSNNGYIQVLDTQESSCFDAQGDYDIKNPEALCSLKITIK